MSQVIAIRQKEFCVIVSDGLVTRNSRVVKEDYPKVFKVGNTLCGFAGDLSICERIKHKIIKSDTFLDAVKSPITLCDWVNEEYKKAVELFGNDKMFAFLFANESGIFHAEYSDGFTFEESLNDYFTIGQEWDLVNYLLGEKYHRSYYQSECLKLCKYIIRKASCNIYIGGEIFTEEITNG